MKKAEIIETARNAFRDTGKYQEACALVSWVQQNWPADPDPDMEVVDAISMEAAERVTTFVRKYGSRFGAPEFPPALRSMKTLLEIIRRRGLAPLK